MYILHVWQRNIACSVFSYYLTICLSLNSPKNNDKHLSSVYFWVDSSDEKQRSGEHETGKEQDALRSWLQLWAVGTQCCWRTSEEPYKMCLKIVPLKVKATRAPFPYWLKVVQGGLEALHFLGCTCVLAEQPTTVLGKVLRQQSKETQRETLDVELWQRAWNFPHSCPELRWARGMWCDTQVCSPQKSLFSF